MNPTTSVGQNVARVLARLDAAARRQVLELVDEGRPPRWIRLLVGALLIALGLAALVLANLPGGG